MIILQSSHMLTIPSMPCDFPIQAAGDCAKPTHRMWFPSVRMRWCMVPQSFFATGTFLINFFPTKTSTFGAGSSVQGLSPYNLVSSNRNHTSSSGSSSNCQVWQAVYPRLVFAPKSEMSESYGAESPQEERRQQLCGGQKDIDEL